MSETSAAEYPGIEKCMAKKYVSLRTPNQWWFIAICETCGRTAVSITNGGVALTLLGELHKE